MPEASPCALILLAAGASTRMGRPKQLLPIGGQPLLRRVAEAALAAPVAPVVVVLGANADAVSPCLDGLAVNRVVNPLWPTGMASSLRCGLETLARIAPDAGSVIMVLADQADFNPRHLERLLATRRDTGRSIVATEHHGVLMPPVCFDRCHFDALRALSGDTGARELLRTQAGNVGAVPWGALADLDTPADYAAFANHPSPSPRVGD